MVARATAATGGAQSLVCVTCVPTLPGVGRLAAAELLRDLEGRSSVRPTAQYLLCQHFGRPTSGTFGH